MRAELDFVAQVLSLTLPDGSTVSPSWPVAARVFRGVPEQTPHVRRWVRTRLAAGPADLSAADLIVSEAFTNAVLHTRSGELGGLVTVAVTAGGTIHVHDQGSAEPVPANGLPPRVPGRLREHGRGLLLVNAMSDAWGFTPGWQCAAGGPGDPAPGADGGCVWARPIHSP